MLPSRAIRLRALWLAVFLGTVACGGSAASTAGQASPQTVETLNIALPVAGATVGSAIVIGYEAGIFKKYGLDVNIQEGSGSNAPGLVVAGQADITQFGTTAVIQLAQKGKDTRMIYGSTGKGLAAMLVSTKSITSIDQLKTKKPCKLASLAPGSSNYGYASYYNRSLNLGCTIATYTTTPEILGAIATGSADATSGTYDTVSSAITGGKANILIDIRKASDQKQYLPTLWTEVAYFGLHDNLEAKKQAVLRFMKGMDAVNKYIATTPSAQVAQVLIKHPDYAPLGVATIAAQLDNDRQFMQPFDGYVSKQNWDAGLQAQSTWGIADFNTSDPVMQYGKRVDMSYYNQAIGKPKNA